jgi:hypothetical protein
LSEEDEFDANESDRKLRAKQKVVEAKANSYTRSIAILGMYISAPQTSAEAA